MKIQKLIDIFDNIVDNSPSYSARNIPVTVHTGGDNWEKVVDIVYCQECNQVHIISERLNGDYLKQTEQHAS